MSSSTLERTSETRQANTSSLTDDDLEHISRRFYEALARPVDEPQIEDLRPFLNYTARFAVRAGVNDVDELTEVLCHAAEIFIAKAVAKDVNETIRSAIALGHDPSQVRGAAFFRRLAGR